MDSLYVIADNCSDDTAQIARTAGAKVIVRDSMILPGKGAALAWFMNSFKDKLLAYDFMVILDADSLIPTDFVEKLSLQLMSGIVVAQCYLSPTGFKGTPLTTLIALSETIEQTVFDRIRSSLGLSVRLRGTGMVIDPRLLLKLCLRLETEVEDIALTLLIAEQKIIIRSLKTVVVFDPKPTDHTSASRQRARWFRGQWVAFWRYRSIVVKLLARGPVGWSVLSSLFLKPRWLKLVLLTILGFVFIWQPIGSAIAFLLAGIEIFLILVGTLSLENRSLFLRSLVYIPGFILMWLKGIFLSGKGYPWLRARKIMNFKDDCKPDPGHF